MKKSTFILAIVAALAIVQFASAESQDAASRERSRARIDTNTTTTVTAYTPTAAGQLLVGKTTSSNRLWIANGTTTNDWVQIAP